MAITYVNMPVETVATLDRDQLLLAWQESNALSVAAVNRERELRQIAFKRCFPDAKEGMNTIELGNGWVCKAENTMNYRIANNDQMKAALASLMSAVAREKLVKYEPKLSVTTWRELDDADRKRIAEFVTITPGLPTIKILEPGAEGNKRP